MRGLQPLISTSYSITLASTVCILYVNVYYVVYNIRVIIIILLASSNIYSSTTLEYAYELVIYIIVQYSTRE